jgi:hypothetical protein
MASSSYSIGDEPSSSNYRSQYCDRCDADTPEQCMCDDQQIDVCNECGEDHRYHNDFSGVQTSIDVIFSEQFNERQSSTTRAVKVAVAAAAAAKEQVT